MLVTERKAFGRMDAASTGKLAAALLTRTVAGPSACSTASNASAICSGSGCRPPACAARPPDGFDGRDAGQAVLLRARDDPDGRAGPRQLDGDGPAETRAGPGDDGRRPGEGAGG